MNIGQDEITSLWVGDMGIKTALLDGEPIYERGGSYCYIMLSTEKEKEN